MSVGGVVPETSELFLAITLPLVLQPSWKILEDLAINLNPPLFCNHRQQGGLWLAIALIACPLTVADNTRDVSGTVPSHLSRPVDLSENKFLLFKVVDLSEWST